MVLVGEEGPVGDPHGLEQMSGKVGPRPALIGKGARVLGAHEQHGVGVEGKGLAVPESAHGPAERAGEAPRRTARVVRYAVGTFARKDGHGALFGPESPLHVIRRPWSFFLVLPDAVRVSSRVAEGGH